MASANSTAGVDKLMVSECTWRQALGGCQAPPELGVVLLELLELQDGPASPSLTLQTSLPPPWPPPTFAVRPWPAPPSPWARAACIQPSLCARAALISQDPAAAAGTGVPLLDSLVALGASAAGLSATSVLLYATAATGAYAIYEQLWFRLHRCAESGGGGCSSFCQNLPDVVAWSVGGSHSKRTTPPLCLLALFAGGARTASWCRGPTQ